MKKNFVLLFILIIPLFFIFFLICFVRLRPANPKLHTIWIGKEKRIIDIYRYKCEKIVFIGGKNKEDKIKLFCNSIEIKKLSIIFICVCSCFATKLADYDTPTKREQKAIDRGNLIIYALAAYYKDNGVYPESLEDLTPVYLDKIPRSGLSDGLNFRTKFQYIKWPKSFRISFRYDMFSEFYYESSEGKWRYENH